MKYSKEKFHSVSFPLYNQISKEALNQIFVFDLIDIIIQMMDEW